MNVRKSIFKKVFDRFLKHHYQTNNYTCSETTCTDMFLSLGSFFRVFNTISIEQKSNQDQSTKRIPEIFSGADFFIEFKKKGADDEKFKILYQAKFLKENKGGGFSTKEEVFKKATNIKDLLSMQKFVFLKGYLPNTYLCLRYLNYLFKKEETQFSILRLYSLCTGVPSAYIFYCYSNSKTFSNEDTITHLSTDSIIKLPKKSKRIRPLEPPYNEYLVRWNNMMTNNDGFFFFGSHYDRIKNYYFTMQESAYPKYKDLLVKDLEFIYRVLSRRTKSRNMIKFNNLKNIESLLNDIKKIINILSNENSFKEVNKKLKGEGENNFVKLIISLVRTSRENTIEIG